jgi:uncharacterized membrane protein
MDRYRAESDYEINLHAVLELKLLQQKLNAIHERDIVEIRRTLKRIEERLGPETGVFVRSRNTVHKRNIRF